MDKFLEYYCSPLGQKLYYCYNSIYSGVLWKMYKSFGEKRQFNVMNHHEQLLILHLN